MRENFALRPARVKTQVANHWFLRKFSVGIGIAK
jgi:hypothetical protein